MASRDILEEYVEEVKEHLQALEGSLLTMEREGANREGISEIFRATHSIKGAAAYMGFEHLASLTHGLESLISEIQAESRPIPPMGINVLLECVDFMAGALIHLQQKGFEPPLPATLLDALRDVFNNGEACSADEPALQGLTLPEAESGGDEFLFSCGEEERSAVAAVLEKVDTPPEASPLESAGMEEDDQELFQIFGDSFREQFSFLEALFTGSLHTPLSNAEIGQAVDRVGRLIASARYMDYDGVTAVLRAWEDALLDRHRKGQENGASHMESLGRLKERLEAMLPGLRFLDAGPASEAPPLDAGSMEEEDQELFTIFMDAFQNHFDDLAAAAPASPGSVLSEESLSSVRDHLAKMLSSSQYMDYVDISDLLQQWDEALIEHSRSGGVDGKSYSGLFDTYGRKLQHMLPGLRPARDSAAPAEAIRSSIGAPEEELFFDEMEEAELGFDAPAVENLPEVQRSRYEVEAAGSDPDEEQALRHSSEMGAKPIRVSTVSEEMASSITLRVDAPKVDQLLNQVGELVVTRSEFIQTSISFREMLRELSAQGKLSKQEVRRLKSLSFRLHESTLSLGRVANNLQDSVMRIRMLPISHLFKRFPRVLRDQALKLGKEVELVIEGGETEIDKRVLEQMHDPIVQFLRNAIAHGIEPPDERLRAGKPRIGTIRLAAYHEGDYVTLEIEDDGRGIDIEKLKLALQSRRELTAEELERLSVEELMYAIFLPGISTHDRVDGSAGRGVGLDVVKENVERMNGSIEVDSLPGSGTRFIVRIPLTVAIIRALLLKGAGQIFTLPLSSVTEILRYRQENTHTIEGFQVISLRGKTIPLVHLSQLLNRPTDRFANEHKFIVVVTTSFREVGLVVDGLIGEREVVIKPIEDDFHSFKGFSGATILGDGNISLILDVSALLRVMKDVLCEPAGAGEKYLH